MITLASIKGLLFLPVYLHNATVQLYDACSNCVSRSMLTQHHSQSAWPQTGRVHTDKGSSHSVSAAASRCLSRVGSPFGWPPWTISSLCTLSRSRPLMTQSETHKHPFFKLARWTKPLIKNKCYCNLFKQNKKQNKQLIKDNPKLI